MLVIMVFTKWKITVKHTFLFQNNCDYSLYLF